MSTGSGKPESRKALGQGISALLGQRAAARPAAAQPAVGVQKIPVEQIQPNPRQPRRAFDQDRLNELAASIRSSGVVQPILVRPAAGGRFEIVAGERRWRAAQIAGQNAIPAVVQDVPNDRLLEVALIENIQREDLNPIETAHAFEQLSRDLALTHEQIAQKTGKDRATITNFLRLLKLASEVQTMLAEGKLSMGHAKALAAFGLPEQRALALRIVAQGLSVRAVEKIAKDAHEPANAKPASPPVDPNTRAAIEEMQRALGARVRVIEGKHGAGRIEIEFNDPEELQRLYKHLVGDDSED